MRFSDSVDSYLGVVLICHQPSSDDRPYIICEDSPHIYSLSVLFQCGLLSTI
jgi:hypothetical protein